MVGAGIHVVAHAQLGEVRAVVECLVLYLEVNPVEGMFCTCHTVGEVE